MTIDLAELEKRVTPPDGLATLLANIVKERAEKDQMAGVVKAMEKKIEEMESLASEQIAASGLDKCRVAGKTWWVDQTLLLSVSKGNRDAVLAAARAEGIEDELLTINTATLKAWLVERCKASESDLSAASSGTAFAGLVSEFVKVRLRSLTVS